MKKLLTLIVPVFLLSCTKDFPIEDVLKQLPPIQATELESKVSGNMVNLNWVDNSTNELGFKIERKSESGQYVIIATIPKDMTSYTDTELMEYRRYTYRVYPYNSSGPSLSYSNEVSVSVIRTVKIGNQIWSATNLNVSTYSDGTPIPEIRDSLKWATATSGAWCWYNNDSVNYSKLGKLYNWYAVNDPRGLAPEGYHIPSDNEWKTLTNGLGGEINSVQKLKSSSGWYSGNYAFSSGTRFINGNGNNSSGLNIIGSGYRAVNPGSGSNLPAGIFFGRTPGSQDMGMNYTWTSNEDDSKNSRCKVIMWYYSDPTTISQYSGITSSRPKTSGMNIRIIKN